MLDRIVFRKIFVQICCSYQTCAMSRYSVILCRHGQAHSNEQDYHCGWCDSKLTMKGEQQATDAGKLLNDLGYGFDIAFCSVLSRARQTLINILKELENPNVPIIETWRLNETHVGDFTGRKKLDAAKIYGKELIQKFRNGYDVEIPPIKPENPYYSAIMNNPKYKDISPGAMPKGECLKQNMERSIPFWKQTIVPKIREGKRVIIVSHNHTLRGIVKYLENMTTEEIAKIDIPNASPFRYDLDKDMKPVGTLKYLADQHRS